MEVQCDRCKKSYKDIFDSIVHMDYVMTGKGKPYEYHLCIECRKELVKWIETERS
jgi:hypothetical protein